MHILDSSGAPTPTASGEICQLAVARNGIDGLLGLLSIAIQTVAVCDLAPDTRYHMPACPAVVVHYVLRGTIVCTVVGHGDFELSAGSVLLIPPGCAQIVAGNRDASVEVALPDICRTRQQGISFIDASAGREPSGRMMCGEMRTDLAGGQDAFDGLTRPIAVDLSDSDLVRASFQTMFEESASPGLISKSLTSALMKACLALVLRRHVAHAGTAALPGLFRKRWISRAVHAVLESPADPHSVASLASLAGRSRSAFSREFVRSVGMPPMDFVNQIRLARARTLLATTGLPINDIAWRIGYASRSHFSRAFRTAFGTDPSSYRRKHGMNGHALEQRATS